MFTIDFQRQLPEWRSIGIYREVKRTLIHLTEILWAKGDENRIRWREHYMGAKGATFKFRRECFGGPASPCPESGKYLDTLYYCSGCGRFYVGSWDTIINLRCFLDTYPDPKTLRNYLRRLTFNRSFESRKCSNYCKSREAFVDEELHFLRGEYGANIAWHSLADIDDRLLRLKTAYRAIDMYHKLQKRRNRLEVTRMIKDIGRKEYLRLAKEDMSTYGFGTGLRRFTLRTAKQYVSQGTGCVPESVPEEAALLYMENRRLKALLRRTETTTQTSQNHGSS